MATIQKDVHVDEEISVEIEIEPGDLSSGDLWDLIQDEECFEDILENAHSSLDDEEMLRAIVNAFGSEGIVRLYQSLLEEPAVRRHLEAEAAAKASKVEDLHHKTIGERDWHLVGNFVTNAAAVNISGEKCGKHPGWRIPSYEDAVAYYGSGTRVPVCAADDTNGVWIMYEGALFICYANKSFAHPNMLEQRFRAAQLLLTRNNDLIPC